MLSQLLNQNAEMIIKYLCNITFFHRFGLVLLTELTYLVAFIPLPVYNFVRFTKILFFYALDYTGLNLGLVVFCLGLARLISSRSRSLSHCLNMVVLTSL